MLRTAFSASFLTPEHLSLLGRVLERLQKPGDTLFDREARAIAVLYLFQSGVSDEEELTKAMTGRR
jgi:hypothetical protein